MTDDGRTLKLDVTKQRELDTSCNLQPMEEGVYVLSTKPDLDTDFIKLDLANVEDNEMNMSNAHTNTNSADQVDQDDTKHKTLDTKSAPDVILSYGQAFTMPPAEENDT